MEELKDQGNTFFKNKDFDKALEKYKECLDLIDENDDTNLSIINSNLSATFCKLENYSMALEHAVMSTRKSPNWYKAWYRLSFVLLKLDKIEQAKTSIDKTIECCNETEKNEKYILDLKNEIYQNSDYNIIDESKSDMPNMQNMPNMPNMQNMQNMPNMPNINDPNLSPILNMMMSNNKIKEKMENDQFKEKMRKNRSNPLAMFGDPDMTDIMSEMLKSMNNK